MELITAGLKGAVDQGSGPAQRQALEALVREVQQATDGNVVIAEILQRAGEQSRPLDDDAACRRLRNALEAWRGVLRFRMIREAPLPEGYPEPGPVGQITIKRYPACRLARTPVADGRPNGREQGNAFMTLFRHIQKNEIAMTAPVEMTYHAQPAAEPVETQMAFLYRSTAKDRLARTSRWKCRMCRPWFA